MSQRDKSNVPSPVERPKEVRAEIQKGLAALDRGEKLDGKEVFRRLKIRVQERTKQQKK